MRAVAPDLATDCLEDGASIHNSRVLAEVALLAAWLPATRAGNLDPVAALRHEA